MSRQPPPPKVIGPPFHLTGVSHAYLDELPNTGVSAVYNEYTPEETKKSKEEEKRRRRRLKREEARRNNELTINAAKHDKIFKICAASDGDRGCINPFPNKWVNADELDAAEMKKSKRRRNRSKNLAKSNETGQRPKGAGE